MCTANVTFILLLYYSTTYTILPFGFTVEKQFGYVTNGRHLQKHSICSKLHAHSQGVFVLRQHCFAVLFFILIFTFAVSACGDDDDDENNNDNDTADDDSIDDDASPDDDDDDEATCGDGVCSGGENCLNCLADCECFCGDGVCSFGEFCAVCPDDCDCETLAATPPMGWNSWNRFGCDIDENMIREMADAMVETGMRDAGYVYLNLDDCWQSDRDADGTIIADPDRFPSGIPALADYVHSLGLRFGLYTCAGTMTCAEKPGSYNYEYQDAQTYVDWNVDYVKVDWCFTEGLNAKTRYTVFRNALDAAGGGIVLSICNWGRYAPWMWGPGTGELWRTTSDIKDYALVMWWNMLYTEPLAPFAGPGAWNDPDMLEVGNGGMSDMWYRTHLNLWAMMAAPLIAGNDLRTMDADTQAMLTNAELIAVDQDPAGIPGKRLTHFGGLEVWARPLTLDGLRAVVLFNNRYLGGDAEVRWSQIGLASGGAYVHDIWTHEDLGFFEESYSVYLGPFESRMFLVAGNEHSIPAGDIALGDLPWKYTTSYRLETKRNRSVDGNPLSIAGVEYESGLGTAAASQIFYHLGGQCSVFTAEVGIDDETNGAGSVVFQVWADGERLFDSGVMHGGDAARSVEVDLTGSRELKLFVRPAADNAIGDHADWANARLVCF